MCEGGMQISVAEQLHNTLRAYVARPLSAQRQMHRRREREIRDRFSASKKVLGVGGMELPSPCASALACQFLPSSSYLPFKSLLRDFSLKRCEMASNCLCGCACPTRSSSHQLLSFVKTLLARDLESSNLNRHRDNGASDLKDSGSATPASIKFTFYQVRTEPRTNSRRRRKKGRIVCTTWGELDGDNGR